MTEFSKNQSQIDPSQVIGRQHAIPFDVRKYAGEQQLYFTGQRGRGRKNVPSLADIYQQLTEEGMAIVNTLTTPPVFTEIGQPENCVMAKIRFHVSFDSKLRELKARADAGDFVVTPADDDARQVTQISLISLAVNLMRIAIADRTKPKEPESFQPFISRETGAKLRAKKVARIE